MSDLVESAISLQEALERVAVAKQRWPESCGLRSELLEASEAARRAVVALTGIKP